MTRFKLICLGLIRLVSLSGGDEKFENLFHGQGRFLRGHVWE